MSDNKVIKSRILQRTDTEEKWNAINPVLSCSEIIFSKTPGGVFMKLGDGRKYSETPFYQDIKIDESQISSLNILHISQSDYSKLVAEDNILSNALYIISSDNMDMMGEQIKNLADATDLSDAVNLHQMQDAISQVNEQFSGYVPTHRLINGIQLTGNLSVGTITGIKMNGELKGSSGIVNLGTVLTAHQSLSNYATKNELSTKSSVFVDNNQTDLNVIHIDNSEYSNLVATDSIDNSTIYIVSSDNLNMTGEKIINLADGTDLSDAVNLGQMTTAIETINTIVNLKSTVSVDGQISDIQIVHVELSDYEQLIVDDNINPNYVYITQGDTHNVYGERITNVAEAIDENDAIPLKQVQRDYISKTDLANALSQLNENNCTVGDILNALKSLI